MKLSSRRKGKPALQSQTLGYLQIFLAGCLWGTIGLFVTLLNQLGADDAFVSFMRLFTACLGTLALVLLGREGASALRIDRRTLVLTFFMGLFGQAVFNLCYAQAIRTAGVATAAVLLYTAPVFVYIMAMIFFKEAPAGRKAVALLLNVGGCALTVTGGNLTSLSLGTAGLISGVLAGFFYALSTVLSKAAAGRGHPTAITFYAFLFATLSLILLQPSLLWSRPHLSAPILALGLGYGLLSTVLAYLFFMAGLAKGLEASRVTIIASVETVVAALIGVLVFREAMGPGKLLGIALVLASIAVMNAPSSDSPKTSG